MNEFRVGPNDNSRKNSMALQISGEEKTAAVLVRDANKWYGSQNTKSPKMVLNNLDMTVPRGVIYGLLGASGCGKTTLLSCIVGRRSLNSGEIWVLGGKPGTPGSGVPGPRIGYMPQEIAMINEFNVRDAIYYFGRIYGMTDEQLSVKFRFLSKLLELPPDDRLLGNCSGGQQRRISFAAALVHEPQLLILDEPTVGLDPVLREIIWEHLIDLTVKKNTAVIITTHYIEETRKAHLIGLMRGGELMAEESPTNLCSILRCESLEQAFYELSVKQTRGEPVLEFQNDEYISQKRERTQKLLEIDSSKTSLTEEFTTRSTSVLTEDCNNETHYMKSKSPLNCGRLKALFGKTVVQFIRHPGTLFFNLFFPILQVTVFYTAIGNDPSYLKMAISNDEVSDFIRCKNISNLQTVRYYESNETCEFGMLSCRFLNKLDENLIVQEYYDNLEDALEAVKKGRAWGVIHFAHNFSEAIRVRTNDGRLADDSDMIASEIEVFLDNSDFQIYNHLEKKLLKRYKDFAEEILEECKENKKFASVPILFHDPIYGNNDIKYTEFVGPGFVMTTIFFLAVTITSTTIIQDRCEGIWDRSIVAGVKTAEIMLMHLVMQFLIALGQIVIILFLCFILFDMKVKGNIVTFLALLMCQGFSGICLGFLLSVVCNTYFQANFASTGCFYPLILLCGVIWPVQGMPYGLKVIASICPLTFPVESLRFIMTKGWSIANRHVLYGFVAIIVWSSVFVILSFMILRRKM